MKPSQKRYTHNRGSSRHGGKPQGRYHQNQGRSSAAQRNHLQQQLDKYTNLAREASSTGDKIQAESYYQHAEHYLRVLNVIKADDARIAEHEQAEREAKEAAAQEKEHAEQQDTSHEQTVSDIQTEESTSSLTSTPSVQSLSTDTQAETPTPPATPIRRRRKKVTPVVEKSETTEPLEVKQESQAAS